MTAYDPTQDVPILNSPRPAMPGPIVNPDGSFTSYPPTQTSGGGGGDSGGDSGGGSGSTSSSPSIDPTQLANDWYKAFFGSYGLPTDVQDALIDILKKYASDPSIAQALATQYLRTTSWYQTTFPGFSAGVNNGIFTDETGYRSYLDAINNIYNQYLGRHVSGDEVSALLAEGVSPDIVGRRFAGQAYVNANRNDIQYLAGAFGEGRLGDNQLTALGNENAGIDTQLGQIQQKVLQKAQQIHDKLFTGTLATPSLSIGTGGLGSPSLLGTRGAPDVAA